MMIKVMSYTAMEPQRPGDLARLLRYMLDAKVGAPEMDAILRLAGPPFVRRLVQRTFPWGQTIGCLRMILHCVCTMAAALSEQTAVCLPMI